MSETFREKICRHFEVPLARYEETVLQLTLYPHARWLRRFKARDWLAPDRSFIAEVGRLTRRRGFAELAMDFQCEPRNHRFWRRALRLRVSVQRMQDLLADMWAQRRPATRVEA